LYASGALLVAMATLAFVFSPAESASSNGATSSYSSASSGAKAAYLLLDRLGCQVERWHQPPDELPKDPARTVLILAEPQNAASAEEKAAIREFVAGGGRVIATGSSGARLLSVPESELRWDYHVGIERFQASEPSELTRNAPEIALYVETRWKPSGVEQQQLYGDERGAVVLRYKIGRGEVVWWAGATPLTNFGLNQASDFMLLVNSVGLNQRGEKPVHVIWDEYFHGQQMGFWDYAARTPAPWGLLQLGLLALAALFTFSRRSGPVRPLPRESRLSPLEFVETIGALYERKRAARESLEVVYSHFRLALIRRLALSPSATAEMIARAVQTKLGWSTPGFWEALRQCERAAAAPGLNEAKALSLIQDLQDYRRRFRLEEA
jgi:hypothetical protein